MVDGEILCIMITPRAETNFRIPYSLLQVNNMEMLISHRENESENSVGRDALGT